MTKQEEGRARKFAAKKEVRKLELRREKIRKLALAKKLEVKEWEEGQRLLALSKKADRPV